MDKELPDKGLIEPVTIAEFDIKDPFGTTFHFPGGTYSTQLLPMTGCGFSAGDMMEHFGAEHLPTLKDLHALTELAFAVIEGKELGILEQTQQQALRIFYNNIQLAYIGHTITGERTRDVFSLTNAVVDGDYITVDWLVEPHQVRNGDEFGYDCRERIQAKIPRAQGIVVKTDDGLYDPRTGMPFSTKPADKVGVNEAFHLALRDAILVWGEEHRAEIEAAYRRNGNEPPKEFDPEVLARVFDLFPDLNYRGCVDEIRNHTTYGFSHQRIDARLEPKDDFMVLMVSMDEFMNRDPYCISLGFNNFGDCGMSVRYIQK